MGLGTEIRKFTGRHIDKNTPREQLLEMRLATILNFLEIIQNNNKGSVENLARIVTDKYNVQVQDFEQAELLIYEEVLNYLSSILEIDRAQSRTSVKVTTNLP